MNRVGNCDNGAGPFNYKFEGKSCLTYFEGTWSEWWYLMWDCSVQLLFSVTVLAHSWSCKPYLGNVLSAWL